VTWQRDGRPVLTIGQYGFEYGPAVVERMMSDRKFGVVIRVYSAADKTKFVDVRVSAAGQKVEVLS
jgi:hypothetical protein